MSAKSSTFLKAIFIIVASVVLDASAKQPAVGTSFVHHDWELVCDNTRTCRAAGYQAEPDGDEMPLPVSVLLVRKAGPRQPVTGELAVGDYGEVEALERLPQKFKLLMRINGKDMGSVTLNKNTLKTPLSAAQVEALLTALTGRSVIEWVSDRDHWRLSGKSASAVLLNMDEFQGRLRTIGALVKKGTNNEDHVLHPIPAPRVIAAPVAKAQSPAPQLPESLKAQLQKTVAEKDDCPNLFTESADVADTAFEVRRLTEAKLLVSTSCWMAAYNFGSGYWVVNSTPPYEPVLVTTFGSDYAEGSIYASHKGRGLGDCYSSDTWTWDGVKFVHAASSTTGMCKLIAPGGAWVLPSVVTQETMAPQ